MKSILNRIEFWIILFFMIRLIGITNPPLEISHNWRQATGLMVARNFLEVDNNIMYPRIDDHNGTTGIIGMEFPSLNYIYYLISMLFGYSHWYGRMINLIISSLGLLFYYKLILLAGFNKKIAFYSTIFLAASIWFSFSRKMMPDTYCISLMFAGLYFGIRYLHTDRLNHILLYTLTSTLAVLSKIPAGIYFIFLIPLLTNRNYQFKQRILLALSTLIPLLLTYFWYFVWNPQMAAQFGNWYNIGKPIVTGFYEIKGHLGEALDNFYFDSFSSYLTFSLFVIGLVMIFINKQKKLFVVFILPSALFLIYIFKSGSYFYHHNYYIIPFVPIMALVAGYSISLIQNKYLCLILLIAGVTESIANQQHDFFIKKSEKYKASLESVMDKVSDKNDLVAINGNGNPQLIYLSNRKGWNCTNEQLSDSIYLKTLRSKNCKYLIMDKHTATNVNLPFSKVFENENFLILEIKSKFLIH